MLQITTHKAILLTESKWAPVIMFTKVKRQRPLQEFIGEYYKIMIIMVLLSPTGSVTSLRALFRNTATFSVIDY